eukprot:1160961-Heterocapsa_arctica.AAC.1
MRLPSGPAAGLVSPPVSGAAWALLVLPELPPLGGCCWMGGEEVFAARAVVPFLPVAGFLLGARLCTSCAVA